MARAEAGRRFLFCGYGLTCLCGLSSKAYATPPVLPDVAVGVAEDDQLLGRVEVAMLGDVERDPVLFERIRSLFPPQTAVVLRDDRLLDQRAVLLPQRADTVYIWIRVSERTQARVYLALAEQDGQVRYLFREVRLDSGLDEVGGETLAQVAHSSARALWRRERQSSRQVVVEALAREAEVPQPKPPTVVASPVAPVAIAPELVARDSPQPKQPSAGASVEANALRLGLGASGTTHRSGAEGWLQELGGFITVEFRARLSLRAAVRYLVPSEFELAPARVRLSGASAELRAGWLSNQATRPRVRLELGFGALFGHAQGSIVEEQPKAHALDAQSFQRTYALAAAGFEWPIGPAWVAASADLRLPLRTTSYEVGGQTGGSTSPSLCPGGSLEVGIGFEPRSR
jgi:hypothetical protein